MQWNKIRWCSNISWKNHWCRISYPLNYWLWFTYHCTSKLPLRGTINYYCGLRWGAKVIWCSINSFKWYFLHKCLSLLWTKSLSTNSNRIGSYLFKNDTLRFEFRWAMVFPVSWRIQWNITTALVLRWELESIVNF